MSEQYQIGDIRICRMCGKEIRFTGQYWQHIDSYPRHLAEPKDEDQQAHINTAILQTPQYDRLWA